MSRTTVAIVGVGNLGTDLIAKIVGASSGPAERDAERAAHRNGVDHRSIVTGAGRRVLVGGHDDMISDV
ncbi:MAG: hypothetical protein H7Y15_12540, partial [Pseudonocardia sp.]|nr:hypothetical protein [Pseudonocardia sp.]